MCYVFPIFEYGLVLWISGTFSTSAEKSINACFTKYLKRYLNVPLCTNSSKIYFLTNTVPLLSLLKHKSHSRTKSVYMPACTNGVQLTFFNNLPASTDDKAKVETPWALIPSEFWRSRTIWKMPSNPKFRRKLCREICDSEHYKHCCNEKFHSSLLPTCTCKYCGNPLHAFHIEYGYCDEWKQ